MATTDRPWLDRLKQHLRDRNTAQHSSSSSAEAPETPPSRTDKTDTTPPRRGIVGSVGSSDQAFGEEDASTATRTTTRQPALPLPLDTAPGAPCIKCGAPKRYDGHGGYILTCACGTPAPGSGSGAWRTRADALRFLAQHGINTHTPKTWKNWSAVPLEPKAILEDALSRYDARTWRVPWKLHRCEDVTCLCHEILDAS